MYLEKNLPNVEAVSDMLHQQQDAIAQDIIRNCAAVAQLSFFKMPSMSRVMQHETMNLVEEQARVSQALEILEAGGDDAVERALRLLARDPDVGEALPASESIDMAQAH